MSSFVDDRVGVANGVDNLSQVGVYPSAMRVARQAGWLRDHVHLAHEFEQRSSYSTAWLGRSAAGKREPKNISNREIIGEKRNVEL
ncbi:MAG: hypothetical protein ACREUA_02210 [Burkholderiales bacterium]